MALVEAAGTVRMASPTSIGLMRRAQGVTRWSDKNAAAAVAAEAEVNAARRAAAEAEAKLRNEAETNAAIPTDAVTLIVTGTVIQENVRNEIEDSGRSWEYDAGLGLEVDDESAGIGALGQDLAREGDEQRMDGGGLEYERCDQTGSQADEPSDVDPVILTEPVERGNVRNEIEGGELVSAEEDELDASEEEMLASVGVKEESFSFGRAREAVTRETFDETLGEIKGLLPNIARVLGEERKLL